MGLCHSKDEPTYAIPKHHINYDNCENTVTREIELKGVEAKVDRVHVNGISRTRDDIMKDAVKDLFTAKDFEEVLFKAHKIKGKLESLGCFRNIAIYVDTSKGPDASPNGLEVTYQVREFKRVIGGVTTQVGDNEGFLTVGLSAPNILGRGERLQTQYSLGSRRTNKWDVSIIKPFMGKHNPVLTASVYQLSAEWPMSSYKLISKGFLFDFGINSFAPIRHNFQWDVAVREVALLSNTPSFDVREESGMTLKSALRHILTIDLRDNVIFPSCGSLLKLSSEIAGVGGDVGFVKNNAFFQTNIPITKSIVLQASVSGGILNRFSDIWNISITDMFYLGGPLCVRGFQSRGIGPRSEGDSLGSNWFWATGLHLYTPVPFISSKSLCEVFRTHIFCNIGNIGDYSAGDEILTMERLKQNLRFSYGMGLAVRLGQMARVELNYCFPVSGDAADLQQPGIQFGIGDETLTLERLKQNLRSSYGMGLAVRLGQMARVELNYCIPFSCEEGDLQQSGIQFGIGVEFL